MIDRVARNLLITAVMLVTFTLLSALTACGGGDPEDDGKVPPPTPVDCKLQPELCK